LKLVNLNKLVVHAGSGNVILLYMNLSLACDYRIVADNTVYQNPNIELDVVPNGYCRQSSPPEKLCPITIRIRRWYQKAFEF